MSNTLHGVTSHTMIVFYLDKKWAKCKVSGAVVLVPTTVFARVVRIVANVLGMGV
jgi:hypothetical protein